MVVVWCAMWVVYAHLTVKGGCTRQGPAASNSSRFQVDGNAVLIDFIQ